MKQRLSYVLVLALATGGLAVSGCGDDDSSVPDDNGGSAGAAGTKTAGASSGGSSNKAGSHAGGQAGNATAGTGEGADGGMGGTNEAGAGGNSAGAAGSGGDAGGAAGAAGSGGAAGAGGAGEPALVYACGSANQFQKICSAWAAAECDNATVCADCVPDMTAAREGFQNDPPCDTCNAKYDAFYQCQIDAFESGNLAAGVECFEGTADGTADCYPFLDEAIACQGYVGNPSDPKDCPATWPLQ